MLLWFTQKLSLILQDANGHLLEWRCDAHETDKFKAVCKLCDKEIQVANNGYHALLQHAGKKP